MFIVFAGLPGVGKSTIAREVSRLLPAVYLRIDSLEHAMVTSNVPLETLGASGYHAAAAVAIDNLINGLTVVADSVNPWPITRKLWRDAAEKAGVRHVGIEICCTDKKEHRHRVEKRAGDIEGFSLPTWQDVLNRDYIPWDDADTTIDTARFQKAEAVERIISFCKDR